MALYLEGGIRCCEIGTVMFGRQPDGTEEPAAMDLVRLAIPRRTYTQSHVDYVIEVCELVAGAPASLRGLRIVEEPPAAAALHGALRAALILPRPSVWTTTVGRPVEVHAVRFGGLDIGLGLVP